MKNITTMTSLGILALSIAATTVTNSIYLVGVFILVSLCALGIRQLAKKFELSLLTNLMILSVAAISIRLCLGIFEPTLANHVILLALPFHPLLVAIVAPTHWQAKTLTWMKAILLTSSAVIIIGVLAELFATGAIFGFELPFLQASSFFQTSGGILMITAAVLALTQIGKRGERA